MVEIRCIISGRVQQVAYRAYVQDAASSLSLVGYVRNLPNQTVEVIAQGTQDDLKEFVEYLHEGSLMAKVDSVAVDWGTIKRGFEDFSIRH